MLNSSHRGERQAGSFFPGYVNRRTSMMRTVRITLTLALALLIATPLLAQEKKKRERGKGGQGPGMGMQFDVTRMLRGLKLTDEQEKQIKEIRGKHEKDLKEAAKAAELTPEQQKARQEAFQKVKESGVSGAEARKAFEEAMKSVKLTPEQTKGREKLGEITKAMMKEVREVLTEEQRKQLDERRRGGGGKPGGGEKKA